jgi:hypothetical protein
VLGWGGELVRVRRDGEARRRDVTISLLGG